MTKKIYILLSMAAVAFTALFTSCGSSQKALIVPHAVSTVELVPVGALNLQKGDYDILASVTETASVTVVYEPTYIRINSGDGDFSYTFRFDKEKGWYLDTFTGIANFGYVASNLTEKTDELPSAEEFARKVATARLIDHVKDYGADGIIEPIVTTRASNVNKKTVEYQATVRAKIFKLNN